MAVAPGTRLATRGARQIAPAGASALMQALPSGPDPMRRRRLSILLLSPVLLATAGWADARPEGRATEARLTATRATCADGRPVLELRLSGLRGATRVRVVARDANDGARLGGAASRPRGDRARLVVPLSLGPDGCALVDDARIALAARVIKPGGETALRAELGPSPTPAADPVVEAPAAKAPAATPAVGTPAAEAPAATPPVGTPAAEPPAAAPAGPRRAVATRWQALGAVGAPVREASGLVQSVRNPGVWWTHDDSGGAAALYAIDGSGAVVATLPLAGATNRDWEDLALGPGPIAGTPYLYVGDIGDNAAVRSSVRVYRVEEPRLDGVAAGTTLPAAPADVAVLAYEDGARDAESLVVDPGSGELWVITKREAQSRAYRAGVPPFRGEATTLRLHATLPFGGAVAADVCADGQTVLVKTYGAIRAFVADAGIAAALRAVPAERLHVVEPQGESIAAAPDCSGYATLSEGVGQPLLVYAE